MDSIRYYRRDKAPMSKALSDDQSELKFQTNLYSHFISPAAGNALYLYLLCLNFTMNRHSHRRYHPHEAALNAQLLHNKTIELLRTTKHENDVVAIFGGDTDSSTKHSYWREHDLLTPLTNYFQTMLRIKGATAPNNSYHASDAYVQWFCSRLEGNLSASLDALVCMMRYVDRISDSGAVMVCWCICRPLSLIGDGIICCRLSWNSCEIHLFSAFCVVNLPNFWSLLSRELCNICILRSFIKN